VKRRHGFLIAVVLGAAAVAGTSAMLQTVSLGADAKSASEQEIAKADVRLDRQEAKIRRAAKRRPPKLPKLPDAASAAAAGGAAPAPPPAPATAPAPAPAPSSPAPVASGHGGHDDDFVMEDRADAAEDVADDRAEAAEDLADERADALEDALDD
jgi:type IV secretory pathway VirB10-like protein